MLKIFLDLDMSDKEEAKMCQKPPLSFLESFKTAGLEKKGRRKREVGGSGVT